MTDRVRAVAEAVALLCDALGPNVGAEERRQITSRLEAARGAGAADAQDQLRADALTVARFLLGWWPGLEDGLDWPSHADKPETHPAYAAAARIQKGYGNDANR